MLSVMLSLNVTNCAIFSGQKTVVVTEYIGEWEGVKLLQAKHDSLQTLKRICLEYMEAEDKAREERRKNN
jgi:hypothetical protein